MKLRIVSNGTARGTRVEDDNGELVENVVAVTWVVEDPHSVACAVIKLQRVPVDVEASIAMVDHGIDPS